MWRGRETVILSSGPAEMHARTHADTLKRNTPTPKDARLRGILDAGKLSRRLELSCCLTAQHSLISSIDCTNKSVPLRQQYLIKCQCARLLVLMKAFLAVTGLWMKRPKSDGSGKQTDDKDHAEREKTFETPENHL